MPDPYVPVVFEAWPSTNTPITAARLNAMQGVVVGAADDANASALSAAGAQVAAQNAAALVGAPADAAVAAVLSNPASASSVELAATLAGLLTRRERLSLREFLVNAAASGGSVQVCGDSTAVGINASEQASWPSVLKDLLIAEGYWLGGDGFSHPMATALISDSWSYTGTWVFDAASTGKQIGGRATDGSTATKTFKHPSTAISVHAYGSAGTSFAVEVDGVAAGALATAGMTGIVTLEMTGLSRIAHEVKVTASGNAILAGISAHGDGLVIDNLGRSGGSTITWDGSVVDGLKALADELAGTRGGVTGRIIALGINDALRPLSPESNGTTLAEFKERLTALIGWAKETASFVALQTPLTVGSAPRDESFRTYGDAVLEVAGTERVPVLDMYERWITFSAAQRAGYFTSDTVHPVAGGYADMAAAWAEFFDVGSLVGIPADPADAPPVPGYTHRYLIESSTPSPIASLTNLAGGSALTQSTEAQRPAVETELGTVVAAFDGINDGLSVARANTTALTVIAVMRLATAAASKNFIGINGYTVGTTSGNRWRIGDTSPVGATDTEWHVLVTGVEGANGFLAVDDGSVYESAVGSQSGSGVSLGHGSLYAHWKCKEILVYPSRLSAPEIAATVEYLQTQHAALFA